ncbi:hypothetical protein [Aurantibacillus circumpalustris]|uniref:hypothetical protein n=1 Tax=Aurantibacillus circumpalustris TaxID=3036359 RepID=UPI00295B5673|nr:hypothetical protein [Aurantibacillus circumpalustris]
MKLEIKKLSFMFLLFVSFNKKAHAEFSSQSNPDYSKIVTEWNNAHNNHEIDNLKNLFADRVYFYTEICSKFRCIIKKKNWLRNKKSFQQEIISPITAFDFGNQFIKCEFSKKVLANGKKSVYPSYLVLKKINGALKIVSEGDYITDANLKKILTADILANALEYPRVISKGSIHKETQSFWLWYLLALISLIAITVVIYFKHKKNSIAPDTEIQVDSNKKANNSTYRNSKIHSNSEQKTINEAKGSQFENFIVEKFNAKYFSMLHWQSDKFHNGVYPRSNMDPDLIYEFTYNNYSCRIAIECKFRSAASNNMVDILKPEQLQRYQNFSHQNEIDVYIALGLGGHPSNPEELYLIPLNELQYPSLYLNKLRPFYKPTSQLFFYNTNIHKLT